MNHDKIVKGNYARIYINDLIFSRIEDDYLAAQLVKRPVKDFKSFREYYVQSRDPQSWMFISFEHRALLVLLHKLKVRPT